MHKRSTTYGPLLSLTAKMIPCRSWTANLPLPLPELLRVPPARAMPLRYPRMCGSQAHLSDTTAAQASILRRPLAMASLFALAALVILLPGLGRPKAMFFDEPYFVPEARALIQGVPNPEPFAPPLAKPPLGRMIIAMGMKVAGDNSFGWRIAGAVCGALTVAAVYLWVFLLLQDSGLAFLAAGLALFNNFLFVMSRIATVDVFLLFFLMWSLVAFTAAVVLPVKARHEKITVMPRGSVGGSGGRL